MPTTEYCNTIIRGDALRVLKKFDDNSIDCLVTDPPYGYSFMGKDWDRAAPSVDIWRECVRVLKPGAFGFVMSAPRQDVASEMISRLEEARFRIDFSPIFWAYASGFPKAMNISKAVDRKLGAKRERIKVHAIADGSQDYGRFSGEIDGPVPITPEAKALNGSYGGFQPKPAVELILVCMKPLAEKTYVDQALATGKGITWLDDARPNGRFPANLLVSDEAVGEYSRFFDLDAWARKTFPFFFVTKASTRERDEGLQQFPRASKLEYCLRYEGGQRRANGKTIRNIHPTVKPIRLMSYLVTLGSRPGDVVLDPFVGSGTTCIAAQALGRQCIGIERDSQYARIARARLRGYSPSP